MMHQHTTIDVSVIIVNWNTCQLLDQCLLSVFTCLKDISFEVVVVDNASTDTSVAMIHAKYPKIRLICNQENVGFGRANNQAMQVARGRYFLLLNSDAELLPGMIEQCIDFMNHSPQTGMVGGELLNADGSFQAGYFDFPTFNYQVSCMTGGVRARFAAWKACYSPQPLIREVDWISGAFMFVRRNAAEQVGLFDERFFMYSEETEWCYRLHKGGWNIHYLSKVKIVHHHRQSSRQAPIELRAQVIRSQLILFWTHYSPLQAGGLTVLSLGAGLLSIGRGIVKISESSERRQSYIRTGLLIFRYCAETALRRSPSITYP